MSVYVFFFFDTYLLGTYMCILKSCSKYPLKYLNTLPTYNIGDCRGHLNKCVLYTEAVNAALTHYTFIIGIAVFLIILHKFRCIEFQCFK